MKTPREAQRDEIDNSRMVRYAHRWFLLCRIFRGEVVRMLLFKRVAPVVLLTLAATQVPTGTKAAGDSPASRRNALLQLATKGSGAIPELATALQDESLVVRRTAVRLLIEVGAPAREVLVQGLENSDAVVRRAALAVLCNPLTADSLPYLQKAMKDADPFVRLTAVNFLAQLKPRTRAINDLLEQARQDESPAVRDIAARAVWPFFKENISIRNRKDWDHDITVIQTIALPKEGWRFKTDPKAEGHLLKWFEPGFDDSTWAPINIESAWEEQGHNYDGIAWYRGWFDLPVKPDCLAAEIVFGGVDEVAWVWINGEYVGQHDIGPEGWDKSFALDVTRELKWGTRNQITVRVHDSMYAGGIWKPVKIEVLK